MGNEEKIYQEWFNKGNEDELNLTSVLRHRDGTPGNVCFLSQQMAEKYLKGMLIYFGKDFPKVHDLKLIATMLEEIVSDIFELDEKFTILNKYYIITRYPGDFPEFSWTEAENAYEAAGKIKKFVLSKIEK